MGTLLLLNPKGYVMARRRRSRSGAVAKRGSFSRPLSMLVPAAIGAGGALAVNGILNYAVPDSLKENLMSGNMVYVTRAGIAILLGLFGPRIPVVGKYASDMARGALIVTMTDFAKVQAAGQGYNLSGLGYIGPGRIANRGGGNVRALPGMGNAGMYVNGGMGRAAGVNMYVNRR